MLSWVLGLLLHLSGLGTGIELCWLALPIAGLIYYIYALVLKLANFQTHILISYHGYAYRILFREIN